MHMNVKKRIKPFYEKQKTQYKTLEEKTEAWLSILPGAVNSFIAARATEAAASIAYYAILSLFPLLLVLIFIGSYLLETEVLRSQLMLWVKEILPTAEDLVVKNIDTVLETRGTVGFLASAGLLSKLETI